MADAQRQPDVSRDEPVIRVRGLSKRFNGEDVLRGVHLDVHAGETIVIIGASGSGKTTLLRHMIASVLPDEGTVELLGQDLAELDEEQLDALRRQFGVLFQSAALFNSMTVGENVALPLREHSDLDDETIDIIVKMKLEQVGLRKAADLMPAELSGGMRKRAGLARAIALDPKVLFYDEPSAGLDPVTLAEIDQLIRDLSEKLQVTSVVVTHEMTSTFRVADRIAMLDRGRIIRTGTCEEFQAIRDGEGDDEVARTIRQFLRGEGTGPLTRRRQETDYEEDILRTGRDH